jgi:hypothetical protein
VLDKLSLRLGTFIRAHPFAKLPKEGDEMPRFFIHSRYGGQLATDDEGQDLPGLDEARAAAIASARDILADEIKHPKAQAWEAMIIANKDGQELATIRAKDILPGLMK